MKPQEIPSPLEQSTSRRIRAAEDRTPPHCAEPEPQTLGAALRHTRQARNVEIRDAARSLHLPVHVIKALEADEFQQLGAPIYSRSYLTRYAELLDLPLDAVLARYAELGLREPPLSVTTSAKTSRGSRADMRWVTYPVLAVGVLWLGWFSIQQIGPMLADTSSSVDSAPKSSNAIALPGQLPSPGTTTETAAAGTQLQLPSPPTPANAPASTVPATEAAVVAADSLDTDTGTESLVNSATLAVQETVLTAAEQPGSASRYLDSLLPEAQLPAASTTSSGLADMHQLALQIGEDCWVEIYDVDGKRLIYSTLKASSQHVVNGRPPFKVTLGNSTAVELSLDGKPVAKDTYWREGGVSRFSLSVPNASG